jgi:hemoglobin
MPLTPPTNEIALTRPALQALFQRIGGEAGLAAILQDFYRRMSTDILIGYFFDGKDVAAIAEMQKRFLMRGWGAAPSYTGKPPAQAHAQLPPILKGHFDRRLRLLEAVLRDHGVEEEDVRLWVAFESAFREGIEREEPVGRSPK